MAQNCARVWARVPWPWPCLGALALALGQEPWPRAQFCATAWLLGPHMYPYYVSMCVHIYIDVSICILMYPCVSMCVRLYPYLFVDICIHMWAHRPKGPKTTYRGTPLNRPVSSRRSTKWSNDLAIFRMDMIREQNGDQKQWYCHGGVGIR